MVSLRQIRQTWRRKLPDVVRAGSVEPGREVTEAPCPVMEESSSVIHSIELLLQHSGIVLANDSQSKGFITRHDAINFRD